MVKVKECKVCNSRKVYHSSSTATQYPINNDTEMGELIKLYYYCRECGSHTIKVTIKDGDGNILDQYIDSVEYKVKEKQVSLDEY